MEVSEECLDDALGFYNPKCRYLREAELFYSEPNKLFNGASGVFQISNSWYLQSQTGHFNAVDLFICYNQLAFSMFLEGHKQGIIPDVNYISYDEFKRNSIENGLITRVNNLRFKKPIDPNEFKGKIEIENTQMKKKDFNERKSQNIFFIDTRFDFENGKARGDIDLAFILPSN